MDRFDGRTAVFIDGPNTYVATKALGFEIDYKLLLAWFRKTFDPLLRVTYYVTVDEDATAHRTIQPLLDYMVYNGYSVVPKPIRSYPTEEGRKLKGGIDIDITVDILQCTKYVENIVLLSGDVNFKKPMMVAQANGCRVYMISTIATDPCVASDELRRQADEFIELDKLKYVIGRGTLALAVK